MPEEKIGLIPSAEDITQQVEGQGTEDSLLGRSYDHLTRPENIASRFNYMQEAHGQALADNVRFDQEKLLANLDSEIGSLQGKTDVVAQLQTLKGKIEAVEMSDSITQDQIDKALRYVDGEIKYQEVRPQIMDILRKGETWKLGSLGVPEFYLSRALFEERQGNVAPIAAPVETPAAPEPPAATEPPAPTVTTPPEDASVTPPEPTEPPSPNATAEPELNSLRKDWPDLFDEEEEDDEDDLEGLTVEPIIENVENTEDLARIKTLENQVQSKLDEFSNGNTSRADIEAFLKDNAIIDSQGRKWQPWVKFSTKTIEWYMVDSADKWTAADPEKEFSGVTVATPESPNSNQAESEEIPAPPGTEASTLPVPPEISEQLDSSATTRPSRPRTILNQVRKAAATGRGFFNRSASESAAAPAIEEPVSEPLNEPDNKSGNFSRQDVEQILSEDNNGEAEEPATENPNARFMPPAEASQPATEAVETPEQTPSNVKTRADLEAMSVEERQDFLAKFFGVRPESGKTDLGLAARNIDSVVRRNNSDQIVAALEREKVELARVLADKDQGVEVALRAYLKATNQ